MAVWVHVICFSFFVFKLKNEWSFGYTHCKNKASKHQNLLENNNIIISAWHDCYCYFKINPAVNSNYQINSCKISTLLFSVNIYLSQLNLALISFISLGRYLYVKLYNNYQIQLKNKIAFVSSFACILWLFSINFYKTTSSMLVLFVTQVVSKVMNMTVTGTDRRDRQLPQLVHFCIHESIDYW